MLINTGASVTILRNDIYDNLLSKPKSESVRASLVNATGECLFYGKAYMKLNIGGKPYEHNVLLADIQNEGILRIDFLKANQSNVMISKGYITIHGKKIRVSHCRMEIKIRVVEFQCTRV
jgi:predicted aspartyl protease